MELFSARRQVLVNQNFCLYLSNDMGKLLPFFRPHFSCPFIRGDYTRFVLKFNKYLLSSYYVSNTFLDIGEYWGGRGQTKLSPFTEFTVEQITYIRYMACLRIINTMETKQGRGQNVLRGVWF